MSGTSDVLTRLLRGCHQRPVPTIGGVVLLVVLAVIPISRLELETSYAQMLPDDAAEVQDARVGAGKLESTQVLHVALSGPHDQRERHAREVADELEQLPSVVAVDFEQPTEFFERRWLLMLDDDDRREVVDEIIEELDRERRRQNPLYADLGDEEESPPLEERLESLLPVGGESLRTTGDAQYLLLEVWPRVQVDTPIEKFDEIVTDTEAVLDDQLEGTEVDYRLSGHMVLALEEYESLSSDLRAATAIAFVVILLFLTLATRRPAIIVGCGVSLVVGLVWTLAATELTLGRLNLVSALMLPALLGLGADFGIHLHIAYQRNLADQSPATAMKEAVDEVFRPCLAAACTTAAGFAALLLCDFEGISEYGIIAGIGIVLMLIATFVIAPLITPRIWRTSGGALPERESFSSRPGFFALLGIATLVVAMAGVGAASFENDFEHLRGELPGAEFHEYLMEDAGRPFDPTVLIVDSIDEARAVAELAREDRFSAGGASTDIGEVVALSDFLPATDGDDEAIQLLRTELEEFDDDSEEVEMLRRAARAAAWEVDEIPESIHRRLTTRSGEPVLALYSRRELASDVEFAAWQGHLADIRESASERGISMVVVDKWSVVHRMLNLIREAFWPMVGLAILLVTLAAAALLQNWRQVLGVVVAVSAGTVALAGALGWMEMAVNLFSIVVLPSIFGIGVDNAIQLTSGFQRDEFFRVMTTRWYACLISTTTTAIGFGAMLVADHRGIASLGATAVVGMGLMFVATSVIIPAVVALLARNSSSS